MQFAESAERFSAARDDFLDFLYLVGIQSVRVLKHGGRRISRFLTPAVRLFRHLYVISVGSQLVKFKRELCSIREGFAIAGRILDEARREGLRRVCAESVRVTGKSFVRHRGFVCAILNVAAPAAACAALLLTVHYWNSRNFGLVFSHNGEQIAAIQDEGVYEQATQMVSQRMVHDTAAGDAKIKFAPAFRLSVVSADRLSSANFICDRIIRQSDGIIEEASGLYVDGNLIGAVKSDADLRFLLQGLLDQAREKDPTAEARFAQKVEIINGLFPTTSIMKTDTMRTLITGTTKAAATYTVKPGDTATAIAKAHSTTLSELNRLNNNQVGDDLHPGDVILFEAAEPRISVETIKEAAYDVVLPSRTVTVQDNGQYTDYSKVKTQGADGLQKNVDRVHYVNGIESKREPVSRTVAVRPVDKVVVTGTKKRPRLGGAGVASGKLMWPVPSLGMITTYFTWRWGSFHTGIDIAGGSAYGKSIVAADGGVVAAAGWRNGYGYCVEINHGNGLSTLYGHASRLLVTQGQKVSKGQNIAKIGSTGNSTGPHLHFEVIKNGTKVNPLSYVHR